MTEDTSVPKVNWKEILVFYLIAVLVSAPFRLNLIQLKQTAPLPFGLSLLYNVLRGVGPLIGFLVVFYVLKSRVSKKISFAGKNTVYSILAALTIPVGLTLAGVNNESGMNRNYYGFITGIMLILYALGEEFGWRGYLQQALAPLIMSVRIVLIATLLVYMASEFPGSWH